MSNFQPQQRPFRQNIKTCYKCGKKWNSFTAFADSVCSECKLLKQEREAKDERAMWKAYCPFCQMLLAEHKDIEAKKCLYNLRGYVNIITDTLTENKVNE
jgi:hypothetical protein